MKKRVTLLVNKELYDQFREQCKKEGIIISRLFEKMMEEKMNKKK